MVYVIESPVVIMKILVKIKNKMDTNIGKGNWLVIGNKVPGKLNPSNALLIEPGSAISNASPDPPYKAKPKTGYQGRDDTEQENNSSYRVASRNLSKEDRHHGTVTQKPTPKEHSPRT